MEYLELKKHKIIKNKITGKIKNRVGRLARVIANRKKN